MKRKGISGITGRVCGLMPCEAKAFFAIARAKKAQGSLEYIMMVAAASVVIVIALAMVIKLKGAVASNVTVNGKSMGVSQAIATEISNLSNTVT